MRDWRLATIGAEDRHLGETDPHRAQRALKSRNRYGPAIVSPPPSLVLQSRTADILTAETVTIAWERQSGIKLLTLPRQLSVIIHRSWFSAKPAASVVSCLGTETTI